MSKELFITELAKHATLSKADAARLADAYARTAEAELHASGEVTLPGLGKLKRKVRPARQGRNPKTGETIQVAEKTVVRFKAAKQLLDFVA